MPKRNRTKEQAAALDTSRVWEVTTSASLPSLVKEIFDPRRYRPLILVTYPAGGGMPRLRPELIQSKVGPVVDIATISSLDLSWELAKLLPTQLATYGGAIRMYWPGARREDSPSAHRLFAASDSDRGNVVLDAIVETLVDRGLFVHPEGDAGETGADRAHDLVPAPWASRTSDKELRAQAAEREASLLAEVEKVRGEAERAAAHAAQRLARVSAELAEARKQIRSAGDQVAELERRLHQRDVFSDPEKQLRHEISTLWLLSNNEEDRRRYPLRDYSVGQEFLASIDGLEGIGRDRVIAGCVDVLTRRAQEMASRKVRQFRTSAASSAPAQVREDGSSAWRANLQTNSPSARRLMWWELPDARVELGRVALHDDCSPLR